MIVEPVTLEGKHVRLEPLSLAHHTALCEVGLDEDVWRWIAAPVRTPEEMRRYIETALAEQAAGAALPFATVERASGHRLDALRKHRPAEPPRRDRLDVDRPTVAT